MIIKLLEQPIIAIHEAEIAGRVDGVVIKDGKVSCIYYKNLENQFVISIENTIVGSDAIMIQDITAMSMASKGTKALKSMAEVYNISGKHLGRLKGIEVDDKLAAKYIFTDIHKLEMSKIVSYDSVIVVDIEEAELGEAGQEEEVEPERHEAAETISMEIGPEIKWNDENHEEEEKDADNSELGVIRTMHQNSAKDVAPSVDAKYAYLCGKRLLEGIDIEDASYEKGTVIGPDLIKHAIQSNAIVKVIVNAEE